MAKNDSLTQNHSNTENLKKVHELIKDIDFAMMTTTSEDGSLHSRPMATQKADFDGTLWFFTGNKSGKVDAIRKDQHVNLAYADPKKQNWVSLAGRAQMVMDKDKMKELWNPILKTWFPDGLEDPNIGLIRVDVDSAEYWDSPSSALIHLYGFVRSKVTGRPPKPGDNERVEINPVH